MGESLEPAKAHKRAKDRPSAGIAIREMELEDLPPVFALGEKLFTAEKWPNLYRTWDEYELVDMFSSDNEFCLVAELKGQIVGFALGTLIEKRRSAWAYGYLVWLGVSPVVNRSGVGTRLLNRETELFIENGARMMLVDTEVENVGAIRFFKQQGFGHDIAHIYLSKNLTNHPGYLKKRAERMHGEGRHSIRKASLPGASFPTSGENKEIQEYGVSSESLGEPEQKGG